MNKRFSLQRILKLRDKLIQALRPYLDKHIVGETVSDLAEDVYNALPPFTSHDAGFETCRCLAGTQLTMATAAEFAWRIAGNLDNLLNGVPVVPWSRQLTDEWLPVQVLRLDPAYKRGKNGFMARFRVLAGSYCPGIFEQFLSQASCAAIAYAVGFSRTRPYTYSAHLTNLRFAVLVEAARSAEQLYFKEIDCPAAMKAHNIELIDIRVRNKPCLFNYDHMCESCSEGYITCPAAIFQQPLISQHCPKCDNTRPFDLSRSSELCLNCWQSQQLALPVAGS
jgi:hypothetical protein